MNASHNLHEHRLDAALQTKGVSSGPIHASILNAIQRLGLRGDVLDFGAGSGALAERLLQSGQFSSVTALDIQQRPSSLPAAIPNIVADLNEPTPLKNSVFDVIVSSEVIEHLENPRAVMREWNRLLRTDGWVVFSTPNNESWRSLLSLLLRGHYAGFSDANYPAHITALLGRDIERLASETGFASPSLLYTNHGYVPRFTSFTWQSAFFGLPAGRRYSDNVVATLQKRTD